jgi:formylglycine-generating enzyme required for sulfatase activity
MSDQSDRVLRGGGWRGDASSARVAARFHNDPSYRSDVLGFRLVEEPKEVHRVLRGSGWNSTPAFARVASRTGFTPSIRYNALGFRLVEE